MDRLTASTLLCERDLGVLEPPPHYRIPATRKLCDGLWLAAVITTLMAVVLGLFTPLTGGVSGLLLMGIAVTAAATSMGAVGADLWLTVKHQRQLQAAGIPDLDALAQECLTPSNTPQYRVCMVGEDAVTHIRLMRSDIRAANTADRECLEEQSFHGGETQVMNHLIEYREELEQRAREYNRRSRQAYLHSVQQIAQAGQLRELLGRV